MIDDAGWTQVTDAANDADASLVVGALQAQGIETQTRKSTSAPGAWLTGSQPQWTPVLVFVRDRDAERATQVLEDLRAADEVEVDADDVDEYRQRRFPWEWIAAAIVLVSMVLAAISGLRSL